MNKIPKSELEFNILMEKIDLSLKDKNIPITARDMAALLEIYKRIGISSKIPHSGEPIPGNYEGDNLTAHVEKWFQDRYGDRLLWNPQIGCSVFIIRGDPWRIYFPKIFGTVYFTCSADLEKYQFGSGIKTDGTSPIYNILNCFENMTPGFANCLSQNEKINILNFFTFALHSVQDVVDLIDEPYMKEAKADLDSAVNFLFSKPQQFGLSKYHSLQFTEKLLKCYLKINLIGFKKTHNLQRLANKATGSKSLNIKEELFEKVQCEAGVRYGENEVTLSEAISTHHASLEICSIVAPLIISNQKK